MIYSIETTARILNAMQAAKDANNGYAFVFVAPDVAQALNLAGFKTLPARHPINGRPCYRTFTPDSYKAWEASRAAGALL